MPIAPRHIDAAGLLYVAGLKADGPLDRAFTRALRELGDVDDAGRSFAVLTAQGMFRVKTRIDAACALVKFDTTRHALVCMYLLASGVDALELPVDRRGARQLLDAWQRTADAPLHVRTNTPAFVVQALQKSRGDEDTRALCEAATQAPPMTLRANTLKTTQTLLIEALAREGFTASSPRYGPDAVVLKERANIFSTRAFVDGWFEVQDEGSQLVSLLCEARAGMVVVDACAGAGGKTLHLAAQMQGKGSLYACDTHTGRLRALKERAARAGAQNIRITAVDENVPSVRADVVLVDAPCSGTGVLRRNPDTSWTLRADHVDRMAEQQQDILRSYAHVVKPGGRLVYATCSVLAQENQTAIRRFLQACPGFDVVNASEVLARAGVTLACPEPFFSVAPHTHDTDGFFAAVLQRRTGDA